jgi:outer membrane protein OmpA-like peptidoglycan-associated protein
MNKSNDADFKRDFEVHYKSEKDHSPVKKVEKEEKPHLPTVPKEEKVHTIPPKTPVEKPHTPPPQPMTASIEKTITQTVNASVNEKEKSPVRAILLVLASVVLLGIIVLLTVLRPWKKADGTETTISSDSSTGEMDTAAESDHSGAAVLEAPATPEPTEIPEVETAALFTALNEKIEGIGNIYFEPDTTVLLPDSTPKLDALASLLREMKGKLKLSVTGHTAKWGTQEEQYELSVIRAKLIVEEMVRRSAIDEKATSAIGVGATDPATTDAAKIGLNRRVEIVVAPID